MVIFGVGPFRFRLSRRVSQELLPGSRIRFMSAQERNIMNASNCQINRNTATTRVLRLNTSDKNAWVVCTLDAVPVILARFDCRSQAESWQGTLSSRKQAA